MKKLFSALLVFAMMFSLVGCGSGDDDTGSDEMKVAMITDSGDITDQSFNQITYESGKKYCEDNDLDFKYYKPESDTDDARIQKVDKAVEDGYNVILMPGYLFAEAISYASFEYPDVKFIGIDISKDDMLATTSNGADSKKLEDHYNTENVYLTVYKEEIPGYMAGYAAVKMGYTKLGFLGGISVPAVMRYGYGYIQGADAAAKELGITVDLNYVYGGQFYGDSDITSVMDTWYKNGTEVVFACGGAIYTSACEAAGTTGKIIGVDVDQHDLITEKYNRDDMCITSAMKGLSPTVNTLLTAISEGKFDDYAGTIDNLGMVSENSDENYVALADKTIYNDTFTKDDYTALVKAIYNGDVKVSNVIDKEPTVTNVNVTYQDNIK